MWGTVVAATLLTAPALGGLAACEQSAEDRRDDYCKAVSETSHDLTRTADEEGPGAFLVALPMLEELGAAAPRDLKDEWQVYLAALRNLRDVLAEVEVEPEELVDRIPKRLSRAERERVRGALVNTRSEKTRRAAQGITQHALDVCDTQIL